MAAMTSHANTLYIQLTITGFDLGLEISTVIVSKSSVSNSLLEI